MNVFEAVKGNVTTRQAAELYGIPVNRHGMAVCPFHNDKNPSMKVDKRFHCFACQADGDAVDFVSRLFGLPVLSGTAPPKLLLLLRCSFRQTRAVQRPTDSVGDR